MKIQKRGAHKKKGLLSFGEHNGLVASFGEHSPIWGTRRFFVIWGTRGGVALKGFLSFGERKSGLLSFGEHNPNLRGSLRGVSRRGKLVLQREAAACL